jgi:agmatine/peptidylarginine deiminase
MIDYIRRHNQTPQNDEVKGIVTRPVAEYENPGYLIFSDSYSHNSKPVKLKLAKELPSDMKLVVFTPYAGSLATIKNDYKPLVGDRLIVMEVRGNGFWARDGVPIPVWDEFNELAVVDAKYYHAFESDQIFADYFGVDKLSHSYFFEGGNFQSDSLGNCMIVDNFRVQPMGLDTFKTYYGCKTLKRFEHLSGIGHIDEVVKLIDNQHVVTDHKEYAASLKSLGYTVTMLPQAKKPYETYVNSLLLQDKLFMPSYGRAEDKEAQAIYESFGFEVFPLDTYELSNNGHGSIHCITMVYPKTSENNLEKILKGKIL